MLTYRELDTLAKTADRQRWVISATNAFYSNANIQPKQPLEVIPPHHRPKPPKVDEATFLRDFENYRKRNKK